MPIAQRVIRQRTSLINSAYRMIDAISITIGLYVAMQLNPSANSDATIVSCLAAIGLFNILSEFSAMYRNWQAVSLRREMWCALFTWSMTFISLVAISFFSIYTTELASVALATWFMTTPLLSMLTRIGVRQSQRLLVKKGIYSRGYAVVGATDLGVQLVQNIQKTPNLGLNFSGFYDDRPDSRTDTLPEEFNRRLGTISELVQDARDGKVGMIYITLPMRAEKRVNQVLRELSNSTASVYVVPDFFVFELLHSRWTDIQGLPVVSIFENPFYGVDGVLKRITDVAMASAALALFAIPMAMIAALVKLTSKGPVFFRQKRYGLDGNEIFVWKFRSMSTCDNGPTIVQATKNDARITPVGKILRMTSLDELPQLFNVILGNMSMVGPRPHATAQNEHYREQIQGYMLRHKVKPGITGLAQVSGWRGETDTLEKMESRIECDHRYIREWSLGLDLNILFKTFFVVLSRQNAY